jgi:hypothetical protein
MKILGVVALMFALLTTPAYAGKQSTFDKKFEAQIAKSNAALKVFADTPCISTTFQTAATNLETEAGNLKALADAIPDSEDEMLQAHQTELFIGFLELTTTALDQQSKCREESYPKKDAPTVDPGASNS